MTDKDCHMCTNKLELSGALPKYKARGPCQPLSVADVA
eukprot:CAMPEP_0197921682 /NCGR_PEP_ID=MMETSP1439-20131203/91041_1 /TAXON_ID=66791 /ORGANISM="Gonyaulax spinifera, Strain CCMP409" /LENGTH=37 /DNA_ID= /DNA_START= /DNA_END= /DNA_ORIENTATION=